MTITPTGWIDPEDCRIEDLQALTATATDPAHYPHADDVRHNVLVYGDRLRRAATAPHTRRAVQTEIAHALLEGPGIVVLDRAFPDTAVVDTVTTVFEALIEQEKAAGTARGDHFARPGANDRVWRALDKLALRDPVAFAAYYANDAVALVCEAWLGPGYQMTSQVNVVNPSGAAQVAHRDYHLGFMSGARSAAYAAHIHRLSPLMTLQGAVAHCDMPVETGPTMYLPHSQKYLPGYVASHRPEFTALFEARHVQLPLSKGDAVFFNPALLHAAGTNRTTDVRRMANLLQVSSPFGRAMETVDRLRMSVALYPTLQSLHAAGADRAVANVVAASAEGYAFPTDLDLDAPVGGLAPATQADLVLAALAEGTPAPTLAERLDAHARRRSTTSNP